MSAWPRDLGEAQLHAAMQRMILPISCLFRTANAGSTRLLSNSISLRLCSCWLSPVKMSRRLDAKAKSDDRPRLW